MLIEHGFIRVEAPDGALFTFTPSFGNVARIGGPSEIIDVYAGLHGTSPLVDACHVLSAMCDQSDCTDVIGWIDLESNRRTEGFMSRIDQVFIAKILMRHAIVGKATPKKGDGNYSSEFRVGDYISSARVHFGLSSADAEALSMTEYQTMLEMKFPDLAEKKYGISSKEEYEAAKEALTATRDAALKKDANLEASK